MGAQELINVGTLSHTQPATVKGTTSTVTTTVSFRYSIRGKMYIEGVFTNKVSPIVDAQDGLAFPPLVADQGTIVFLGLNAAGGYVAAQGDIEDLDSQTNFKSAPMFPSIPETMCPWAYVVIKVGVLYVGTWTFGASTFDVAETTAVFQDISTLPDRLQVA